MMGQNLLYELDAATNSDGEAGYEDDAASARIELNIIQQSQIMEEEKNVTEEVIQDDGSQEEEKIKNFRQLIDRLQTEDG